MCSYVAQSTLDFVAFICKLWEGSYHPPETNARSSGRRFIAGAGRSVNVTLETFCRILDTVAVKLAISRAGRISLLAHNQPFYITGYILCTSYFEQDDLPVQIR